MSMISMIRGRVLIPPFSPPPPPLGPQQRSGGAPPPRAVRCCADAAFLARADLLDDLALAFVDSGVFSGAAATRSSASPSSSSSSSELLSSTTLGPPPTGDGLANSFASSSPARRRSASFARNSFLACLRADLPSDPRAMIERSKGDDDDGQDNGEER